MVGVFIPMSANSHIYDNGGVVGRAKVFVRAPVNACASLLACLLFP